MAGRLLGILAALVLLALNLVQLFGWAYGRFAQDRQNRPDSRRTNAAAEHGASLTPWSSERLAVRGWLQAQRGDFDASLASYATALMWAPADAALWTEYALVLARAKRFGELELPVARANALAKASPSIQEAQAAMAASYWDQAGEPVREEWLRSLAYVLKHNRSAFYEQLVVRGQVDSFCAGPATRLERIPRCERLAAP
jgi:hypothetical protein